MKKQNSQITKQWEKELADIIKKSKEKSKRNEKMK